MSYLTKKNESCIKTFNSYQNRRIRPPPHHSHRLFCSKICLPGVLPYVFRVVFRPSHSSPEKWTQASKHGKAEIFYHGRRNLLRHGRRPIWGYLCFGLDWFECHGIRPRRKRKYCDENVQGDSSRLLHSYHTNQFWIRRQYWRRFQTGPSKSDMSIL